MPHYRKHGKIQDPLTEDQFDKQMKVANFIEPSHAGFVVGLYYFAIRKMELLRTLGDQMRVTDTDVIFDVGPRLKKLRRKQLDPKTDLMIELTDEELEAILKKRKDDFSTKPLYVPLTAPHIHHLVKCINDTPHGHKIWNFCPKTAYNIVSRAGFNYPHFFRLSRITNFFLDGWTIAQVRSWTGLSLAALEHYVGIVDIIKMGRSMGKRRGPTLENILVEIDRLPFDQQALVRQKILEIAGKTKRG